MENLRGEFVLILAGKQQAAEASFVSPREQVAALIAQGIEKKVAIKQVAQRMGVPKNDVYMEVTDL